jgi:DNA-directed RNA polymerase beta' subunit
MNIHLAQSIQARNELKMIANVKYQIIGSKNSNPIIGCEQDALSGAYLLSRIEKKYLGSEVANFLNYVTNEEKFNIKKDKLYTGKEIFSYIIPNGINNIKYEDGNKIFEILDGELLLGNLDKKSLSTEKNSIIHFIWDKYGANKTRKFIDETQRLILQYLMYHGFTFSFKDILINNEQYTNIKKLIHDKILEYNVILTQYENDTDQLKPALIERKLSEELNSFNDNLGPIIKKFLKSDNNFLTCINSGSKGKITNLNNFAGCIGQKSVEGVRIKKKIENRCMSIFHRDDDTPEARGFVRSSYMDGLKSYEYFYESMGAREGLIDTAIKTAKTGYIQRKLIKGLEDLSIKYDLTNRNSNNIVIQYLYGECGINPSFQTELTIHMIRMNDEEINSKFGFSKLEMTNINKKFKIKDLEKFNTKYVKKIQKYRDDLRLITQISTNNTKILEDKFMLPINLIRLTQDYTKVKKTKNIELNPQYIIDKIDELLKDPDLIIMRGLPQDNAGVKYLLEIALHDYLNPKKCIFEYELNKVDMDNLMKEIKLNYIKALVDPGEMVGIVAAQSIGEPTSQMCNVFTSKNKIIIYNKISSKLSFKSIMIGEFCDDLIKKHPELTHGTGHVNSVETELESLEDEYYIIGVDAQEKTHWNKISHISRHPVNGQIMKVTTRSGRIVDTTTSHSHLIRSNQTVVPIVGSDMTVGMRIPVAKHIDNTFIKEDIEIDNKTFKLDYLFGWFIGAYLAEGHITFNKISITNISEYYINNTKLFAKRFNKECKIDDKPGEYGPGITTYFNCKELAKLLLSVCETGSFNKHVPDFAFTAPNEFKAGLLQAYFDGDGNFQADSTRNQIRVCSRSEQLIKDIALLLNYFDIFGSIKCNKVKESNMYNLSMSARYGTLYKQHIGSVLHKDKLDKIVEYATRDNVHSLSDDIDKINGLGEVIAKCGKELNLPGQSRNYGRWKKKESIGRRTLEKYIEIFEAHEDSNKIKSELSILRQAANSNVIWDEVVNIELYNIGEHDYVYDFTVPGNQTFMTDYGIIVHNTLNTKHASGASNKNIRTNLGVPRIEELIHYSKDIKTPQMTVYFDEDINMDKAKVNKVGSYLKYLSVGELINSAEIYYDMNRNDDNSKLIRDDNVSSPFFVQNQKADINTLPFVIRLKLDIEKMYDKETSLLDIKTKFISYWQKNYVNVKTMRKNEKDIFSKISKCAILNNHSNEEQIIHIRFQMLNFNYNTITDFLKIVLNDITLKGIENITNTEMIKEIRSIFDNKGDIVETFEHVIITSGINIEKLKYFKGINFTRTVCNDIETVYKLYGIEAARQTILNEFNTIFQADGSKVNHTHISILIDMMTHTGNIISIDRHGLSKIDSEPFAKASFEKQMDHFVNAAVFNEKDRLESVSSKILMGKVINGGTGAFQLLLDTNKLENSEYLKDEAVGRQTFVSLEGEELFKDVIKNGFAKNDFYIPR